MSAALAYADRHGSEAFSMRKLAQELGFEAMSLYNHVANKNDILDGIVEIVASEIELASTGPEWKSAMRRSATSAHDALVRHPWACDQWTRRKVGPIRLRYTESVLRCLRQAGFSSMMAHHAYHVLYIYILGYTDQELKFPLDNDQLAVAAGKFLTTISTDEYPYFTEHVILHINEPNLDDGFAFGLDLILDSLERLRTPD